MHKVGWPKNIIVIRHGQSSGNVARDLAEKNGLASIDLNLRDMDVPLSDLGQRQSEALGAWLVDHGPKTYKIFISPYERTLQTATAATAGLSASSDQRWVVDERLREREFGLITGLTRKGIAEKFPLEVEAYDKIKKFYYRPPGGESWCDVILRVRSFVNMLKRDYADQNIIIVAHTVVVYAFRYVLENLSEKEILQIDRENDLANCSITSFVQIDRDDRMKCETFNFIGHLKEFHEPVTRKPDVPQI